MLDIVKQTLDYYLKNNIAPNEYQIEVSDQRVLNEKWMIFITLYKNWEITWSSWNIVEIGKNVFEEIVSNTIEALKDVRFEMLKIEDLPNVKTRIDIVRNRVLLDENAFKSIDPLKYWIIAIKKDYLKLAIILPNISNSMNSLDDIKYVLSKKLDEEFKFENYIVYSLETEVLTDF